MDSFALEEQIHQIGDLAGENAGAAAAQLRTLLSQLEAGGDAGLLPGSGQSPGAGAGQQQAGATQEQPGQATEPPSLSQLIEQLPEVRRQFMGTMGTGAETEQNFTARREAQGQLSGFVTALNQAFDAESAAVERERAGLAVRLRALRRGWRRPTWPACRPHSAQRQPTRRRRTCTPWRSSSTFRWISSAARPRQSWAGSSRRGRHQQRRP